MYQDVTNRVRIDFIGHQKIDHKEINSPVSVNNLIYKAKSKDEIWIEETTSQIGEWRAIFRSTYMRWALCINGLFVAEEKYSDPQWSKNNEFTIHSLRGVPPIKRVIARWKGKETAEAYKKIIPTLAAFGIMDLYGCLEEFIFAFYRIYLRHNPCDLLQGEEFKTLKKLYRKQKVNLDLRKKWEEKIEKRLDQWQEKKIYKGLKTVFLNFCSNAELNTPSWYQNTRIETWAETIKGIAVLRNALTHGVTKVSPELAEFSRGLYSMNFNFVEDSPIVVQLEHLQAVDMFCEQLLTALNASLIERAVGPKSKLKYVLG